MIMQECGVFLTLDLLICDISPFFIIYHFIARIYIDNTSCTSTDLKKLKMTFKKY